MWDPVVEIANMKDDGLINSDHLPGEPVTWGQLATVLNRSRKVEVNGGQPFGAINVPMAVLWTEPDPKREYDELILGAANDPAIWADGMDAEMRLWLVGKAETQALYGERVAILEQQGDWMKVAAISQRTQLDSRGYPGWVPAAQVSVDSSHLAKQQVLPEVVVAVPRAGLYRDTSLSDRICELSYQTRLPLLVEEGQFFCAHLPDGGTGYLKQYDVKKAGELSFSGSDMVEEARRFLGLKYLWAGTSSYGFDCSGLTFRTYQSQGISIPRDANEQGQEGIYITKKELLPGDLLFFASDSGKGDIHHVGIYTGNGLMIHSPNSRSSVREEAFNSGTYATEYWGARRYV